MGNSHRFLILVFLILQVATGIIPAALGQHYSMPGFLYTRARGRCTSQYWSSRRESWPKMVPPRSTVWKVFGSRASERYRGDLTLVEAASRSHDVEDVFGRLVKESTAALVNSYARKGYPYAAWEVKTLLIQSLVSARAASFQAQKFLEANENCG